MPTVETGGEIAPELTTTETTSESGTEKPLADAIETALHALPHLTVDRLGNNVVARTDLGRAERVVSDYKLDDVNDSPRGRAAAPRTR